MTAPADNPWREKYLNALDEQEKLEQRLTSDTELLRRALVRVSLAAEGQDQTLDEILSQLREGLRGGVKQDISGLLTRLEQAAIAFEQTRDGNSLTVREAIANTLKPLQKFKISRSSKKNLEQYLDQLAARSKKIRLYPALLEQLAEIQQEILQQIEQPQKSLFDKILGKNTDHKTQLEDQDIAESQSTEHQPSIDNKPALAETIHPLHSETASAKSDVIKPGHSNTQQTSLSPEFIQSIAQVLSEFLQSLEHEIAIKHKAESIRQELEKGLAPDKVIPVLENLRNLVMEAYLASNAAFANYLNSVNLELSEIYSILGKASSSNQQQQTAGETLQVSMLQGMQQLETQAANATDLTLLKNQVKSQIDHIKQALDNYQQSAKEFSLGDQLTALSEKIKALEAESEKNRSNLESQRQKALLDPLTELPNRQAYNERVAIEVQRWQRYGRPLSIAVFDIDLFKNINDSYGHQAGDRVIKVIGRSIAKRLREVDFFCRFGGEEFVALLPETSAEVAFTLLDKIRDAIAKASFNYKEQPMSITLSVGITEFKPQDSLESAFERADQALYQAKSNGRNQVKMQ
jgi:diguanylate cyclase